MRIEFSTEAETEGSAAIVLNLFKGYTFDFHMKDGSVVTGEIIRHQFHRNKPSVRVVTSYDFPERVIVLVVDEIDKAVYC